MRTNAFPEPGFPTTRLRRLRQTAALRAMLNPAMPGPEKFLWPVFVREGGDLQEPIASMPGQCRYGIDALLRALEPVVRQGVGGILVFGLPDPAGKDSDGRMAADPAGLVPRTVAAVKRAYPDLLVFTDVCLCAYTSHGHCGPLDGRGQVENDRTLGLLAQTALAHAAAGADAVAPSAMMDGQVRAIRQALDGQGFANTLLMSYSTKFASAMYGPFRDAEQSAPQKGDRQGYQQSGRDPRQAIRESLLDIGEGADVLMVKPALFYLDIIAELRQRTELPIAAYNVSGEYAMLAAMAEKGWGDLRGMVRESVAAMARAGTDIFISYWASRHAELIGE